MPKPIQCKFCTKPATVHLTQIIDNKVHKLDLCEDCALTHGITDPEGFSLGDLLAKSIGKQILPGAHLTDDEGTSADSPTCPMCGTTFEDYKKSGRLGSPQCYEVFRAQLLPLLRAMHRGLRHTGKVPVTVPAADLSVRAENTLGRLREALARAIREERYEDAAQMRDHLRQYEKGAGN